MYGSMIILFLCQVCIVNERYRIPKGQYKRTIQRNWQQDQEKQNKKHKTICVVYLYTQTNTNKICVLLQTIGGKDESNIVHAEIIVDITPLGYMKGASYPSQVSFHVINKIPLHQMFLYFNTIP